VCVIREYYYPVCPRLQREVEALVESGYSVDILCLRRPGEPKRERIGDVEVHRFGLAHVRRGIGRYLAEYAGFFVWAFLKASLLHVKRKYSVVQVNTLPDALVFAAAFPKMSGARVILDMHEVMPELYASKFGGGPDRLDVRLVVFAERRSAAFADRIITVSKPTWEVLVGRGIPPSKLEIVMNAADERIFTPDSVGGPQSARHSSSELVLVSHGVLVERYGFQTIVRALASIRKSYPTMRLLILGEGEYEQTLRELTSELDLEGHVEFLGYRPLEEVVRILRGADIGVTANMRNSFTELIVPTKLMEFVTLGLPAVVARLPAVEEYFDETMVHFFEPDNPEDLASVVCSLAGDLEAARENARRTSQTFLAEYGWDTMKQRYLRVVDDLVSIGG
jgi:glycosyltransferase involved in cell wall biosynthesis